MNKNFQVTLTDEDDRKDGAMAFGEISLDSPAYDILALCISAFRIGRHFSNYVMLGGITGAGSHETTLYHTQFTSQRTGLIVDNSVFYHLAADLVVGVELVIVLDTASKESSVSVDPQLNLPLSDQLRVQVGYGLVYRLGALTQQLLFRLTVTKP